MSGLEIFETLGFRPDEGYRHLDLHLARFDQSCRALGMGAEAGDARTFLLRATPDHPARVRLSVTRAGGLKVQIAALPPAVSGWTIAIADQRLHSADPWLCHKTNRRALYDDVRRTLPEGVDEMLFLNERGACCEGTISNLFVEPRTGGGLITPPLDEGLLPGVLRAHLLATGQVHEAAVTPDTLREARRIFMGNALRGLIRATLVKN